MKSESEIRTQISQGFYCDQQDLIAEFGMTHTKLRDYLNILEILVCRPLEFEVILLETDQDIALLKRYLGFLASHDLVEKLPLGKKRFVYVITARGLAVLNALEGQDYPSEPYYHMMLH